MDGPTTAAAGAAVVHTRPLRPWDMPRGVHQATTTALMLLQERHSLPPRPRPGRPHSKGQPREQQQQQPRADEARDVEEARLLQEMLLRLEARLIDLKQRLRRLRKERSWLIRYSRRMVVGSNLLLGAAVVVNRVLSNYTAGEHVLHGPLGFAVRLLARNGVVLWTSKRLGALIASGLLRGVQSSAMFFACALLFSANESWKRDYAFGISTLYSVYLSFMSNEMRVTNYVNVVFNMLYLVARYAVLSSLFEGLHIR